MFNPCVRSLRALQQASELKNVQRKLGCSRGGQVQLTATPAKMDLSPFNSTPNLAGWKIGR